MRKIIHLYYLAILAPFVGVAWVKWDHPATRLVGMILLIAVALRFRHWMVPQPSGKSEDVNPIAARITGGMVILLSCAQTYFYLSIAFAIAAASPQGVEWLQVLGLGLLTALAQGAALTGIIFASRVIFFCFVLPLVLAILYLFAAENLVASSAVVVLTAVSFYLAETSHKMQLRLFKAQYDADQALLRMEKVNLELTDARRNVQHRAEYDDLTGVRNRFAFIRDVEEMLADGRCGLLALVDLDRFKPINDLYGHHAGDQVLRYVARRLQRVVPPHAIVGRLGGDEFGLFVSGPDCVNKLSSLVAMCDRALDHLRRPIRLSNTVVRVGASAGARLVASDTTDVGQALREADVALYVAKREGDETTKLFDQKISDETLRTHAIEAELIKLDSDEYLSLAYQPIVNLRTGDLASFEALARWYHPTLGEVSPVQFIPIAERLGRIREITLTLLEKALEFAADWQPPCRLSFNLSAAHICGEDAADEIVALISRKQFPSNRLQFEITETAMLVNFEVARRNVEILRRAGCRIALDDFGAGFASLVYLREIKFDKVKIDGSLIREARHPKGRDMLRGVIKMIEAMKLESVAEYIATAEDHEAALVLGAGFGQGFYLGRPLSRGGVLDLLLKHRSRPPANIDSLPGHHASGRGALKTNAMGKMRLLPVLANR
ncbi:EAL domain-containing protein [Erythrobacter sp. SN021]|uniref:putative bifunctional diguanylate cyclase/phosphodiesterase n=1 Tax=Erythrobacter sp. SN021 TaxID=2912574 RepID=UPI001F2BB199|nr:EAL domain-containing protein [Erythrobacter sp. SN021]